MADYTGFPEMLDGRVKTLHPKIHGGILARRDLPGAHATHCAARGIATIDLVVVNLYPFSQTVARRDCTLEEAIENIDIGGPAMVRSAAKNSCARRGRHRPGGLCARTRGNARGRRRRRARHALQARAESVLAHRCVRRRNQQLPDCVGAAMARARAFPQRLNLNFELAQALRYGENPHQSAAFYRDLDPAPGSLAGYAQLQGKELSYNNIADADAAWECVKSFRARRRLRHRQARQSLRRRRRGRYARRLSPRLRHRSHVRVRRHHRVQPRARCGDCRRRLREQFVEVLIAPQVTLPRAPCSRKSKTCACSKCRSRRAPTRTRLQRVGGGLLVQTADHFNVSAADLKVVTEAKPTPQQLDDLLFAWRVAKFVKSNAIVFCGNGRTLGVGAGQMSRIDSARIAAIKAQHAGLRLPARSWRRMRSFRFATASMSSPRRAPSR